MAHFIHNFKPPPVAGLYCAVFRPRRFPFLFALHLRSQVCKAVSHYDHYPEVALHLCTDYTSTYEELLSKRG